MVKNPALKNMVFLTWHDNWFLLRNMVILRKVIRTVARMRRWTTNYKIRKTRWQIASLKYVAQIDLRAADNSDSSCDASLLHPWIMVSYRKMRSGRIPVIWLIETHVSLWYGRWMKKALRMRRLNLNLDIYRNRTYVAFLIQVQVQVQGSQFHVIPRYSVGFEPKQPGWACPFQ